MINRGSLEELADALSEADVSSNSIGTAITILEKIGRFDPNEDLPKDPKDWFDERGPYSSTRSSINFIPGEPDVCHDLLVTVCAGEGNFDLNTMETIALCINCHHKMRVVIIVTDYWVEKEFNKWRKSSFKALHDQFGIIFFLFTPHAGRWIVEKIGFSLKGAGKKRK